MATRLEVSWDGLDPFLKELEHLPADLADEANAILVESAQAAQAAIIAAYPFKTGNLRRGVTLTPTRGRVFAGAVLRQLAPHGWIYENGTKVRRNKAGQNRGRMKSRPTFLPIAEAHQRTAVAAVIKRLYAHGAVSVTVDAA